MNFNQKQISDWAGFSHLSNLNPIMKEEEILSEVEKVYEKFATHARELFKNNFDVEKVKFIDGRYICYLQCHMLTSTVIDSFYDAGFKFIICRHHKEGIQIVFEFQ